MNQNLIVHYMHFAIDGNYICDVIQQFFTHAHDILRLDTRAVNSIQDCVPDYILVDVYTLHARGQKKDLRMIEYRQQPSPLLHSIDI